METMALTANLRRATSFLFEMLGKPHLTFWPGDLPPCCTRPVQGYMQLKRGSAPSLDRWGSRERCQLCQRVSSLAGLEVASLPLTPISTTAHVQIDSCIPNFVL